MEKKEKYNGLIAVWKEKGYTSHDIVARLRGILKQKKIGHTGTLDPQAEGVLAVGLGLGTKTFDLLPDSKKVYRAGISFGFATDTEDIWGKITEKKEFHADKTAVREAIMSFVGCYLQIPPMYSAKKVDGKRLYELARKGEVVERRPSKVEIYNISIEEITDNSAVFTVECSAGTYIRSLCRDIGERLGTKACMSALTRLCAGGFDKSQALTLDMIETYALQEKLESIIIPIEQALNAYPELAISNDFSKTLKNGGCFDISAVIRGEANAAKRYRVYLEDGTFIGIYEKSSLDDVFKPIKIFYRASQNYARD